jgi:hypothetical protein
VHEEESYTFAYYNRNLLPGSSKGDMESGVAIEGQIPESESVPMHPKLAANPRIAPAASATQADKDIHVAPPATELSAEKNGNGKQD